MLVLVLLIIFMVVTPMMVSQGIQLPRAKNGDTIRDSAAHRTITMTASGMLFFDKEPVSEEVLILRLQSLQQKSPTTQVILKADTAANYGAVHHVLDLASGAGFRDLALQAEPVGEI